jgi:hypothetical protein
MDKKIFKFVRDEEPVSISVAGNKIQVERHIDYAKRVLLMETYIDSYFYSSPEDKFISTSKYELLGAEMSLIMTTLDMLTSVDVKNDDFSFDDFMASGSWKQITANISNWEEFRFELERVVSDIKEELALEKSLGNIVEEIADKAFYLLKTISEKVSDADIEEIRKTAKEMSEQIMTPQVSGVLKDLHRGSTIPTTKPKGKKVH